PCAAAAWRELCQVLDEELARLPERLREPLVMCYLEGLTRDESAARLGWPLGTLKHRLGRGRALLRVRLTRRGVGLAVAGLPAALAAEPVSAATAAVVARAVAGGAVAPAVAALARGGVVLGGPRVAGTLGAVLTVGGLLLCAGALSPAGRTDVAAAPPPAGVPGRAADPLPAGAVARLGIPSFRNGNQLSSVALSPDGRSLAVIWVEDVSVWRFPEGGPVGRPVTPDPQPRTTAYFAAAFVTSSDRQLVTVEVGNRCVVRVTDPATGRERSHFDVDGVSRDVLSAIHRRDDVLHFSPDGSALAVLESDGTVAVYDVAAGKRAHRFASSFGSTALAFSGDGRTLVSVAPTSAFQVWDLPAGTERRRFKAPAEAVARMALSPDGRTVATVGRVGHGGDEDRVRLWDVAKGGELRSIAAASDGVAGVAWAPDGRSFFTAAHGAKQPIRQWDPATGKLVRAFDLGLVMMREVRSLLVTPDGRTLVAACEPNEVHLWDVATGRPQLPDGPWRISSLAWGPDDHLIVGGHDYIPSGAAGVARRWEVSTGREVRRADIRGHGLAVSPDGRLLAGDASAFRPAAVGLWDARTLRPLRRILGLKEMTYCCAFSVDG
ncbi:MAG TPA: sigma factor-like helix-turn-helix DNA-binding protein, partial [Gemmataceae bacterium]